MHYFSDKESIGIIEDIVGFCGFFEGTEVNYEELPCIEFLHNSLQQNSDTSVYLKLYLRNIYPLPSNPHNLS